MVEQPLILLPDTTNSPCLCTCPQSTPMRWALPFAVAVIYMIPALLLFLHGEEYLVEGIAHSGSVKG